MSKIIGLIMTLTNFFFFVPLLSFNSNLFKCDQMETACYKGTHLVIVILATISYVI